MGGKWCTFPDCGQISYAPSGLCELHTDVDIEPQADQMHTNVDAAVKAHGVPAQLWDSMIGASDFVAMFLPRPKE
jgi:hypothetical protein